MIHVKVLFMLFSPCGSYIVWSSKRHFAVFICYLRTLDANNISERCKGYEVFEEHRVNSVGINWTTQLGLH